MIAKKTISNILIMNRNLPQITDESPINLSFQLKRNSLSVFKQLILFAFILFVANVNPVFSQNTINFSTHGYSHDQS